MSARQIVLDFNIPLISSAFGQILARLVIALGRLLLMPASIAFFRKALRKHNKE
jgi:hypothetical protein